MAYVKITWLLTFLRILETCTDFGKVVRKNVGNQNIWNLCNTTPMGTLPQFTNRVQQSKQLLSEIRSVTLHNNQKKMFVCFHDIR